MGSLRTFANMIDQVNVVPDVSGDEADLAFMLTTDLSPMIDMPPPPMPESFAGATD